MKTTRRPGTRARCGLAALLCLAAGCVTTPEPGGDDEADVDGSVPLTRDEIRTFYERAKDPREFWITVYSSPEGPVFRGDHRTHPNQVEELAFLTDNASDIPVIEAKTGRLNLHPMLIDTTSAETWVNLETAAAMRLAPLGMPAYGTTPVHVADDVPGFLCVAPTLKAGLINVESVLLFARGARGPLGPLGRGVTDPVPVGVLGTRFLEAFSYAVFDFSGRTVVLSSTKTYKPDATRLLATVPFSMADGYLTMDGSLDDRPASFLVDTAGDFTLLVPDMDGTLVRDLRIGDLHVENVTVAESNEPDLALTDRVRIGARLLSRFKMTLDFKDRVVHFEQPAR